MAARYHVSVVWVVAFLAVLVIVCGGARADFRFGVPRNLGPVVNCPYSDGSPDISADGQSLYFDSLRYGDWDIWVTTRTADGQWGEPELLPWPISTFYEDSGPSISADGLSLYFGSDRFGSYGSYDLWVATRKTKDSPWRLPENLGPRVNKEGYDNHPSISADGLTLYFDSDRPGGQGYDVWVSTRKTPKAAWETPVNLTAASSGGLELSPSIHQDNLYLFWDSRVLDRDIWMSRRRSPDAPWSPRVNLGPPVNTLDFDTDPSVAADGSMLYFAAYRPGGVGGQDLWQVPIFPVVDFNRDGVVDLRDFSMLGRWWQQHDWRVDVGPIPLGDGIVDAYDVAVLAEHWLIDNRLVAHWKLDETAGVVACDSLGGQDAILWGDPVWLPSGGRIGGAVQLDGIDDRIVIDLAADLTESPFSIFAWVKGGAPGQVIVSQAGGVSCLMAAANGTLMTELRHIGRTGKALTSVAVITDGLWHRVGLTWDGSDRVLYVDDDEVARDTQASLAGPTYTLYIGTGGTLTPGTFFSGLIDDVRLYNNAVKP